MTEATTASRTIGPTKAPLTQSLQDALKALTPELAQGVRFGRAGHRARNLAGFASGSPVGRTISGLLLFRNAAGRDL